MALCAWPTRLRETPRLNPGAFRVLERHVNTLFRPAASVTDFAQAHCLRRGIGAELMRQQRFVERRGYIDCTRLRLTQALERDVGRREPHW